MELFRPKVPKATNGRFRTWQTTTTQLLLNHNSTTTTDIMGTILFKPDQAFGEGLFLDNRECKERRLANMPTRALAF